MLTEATRFNPIRDHVASRYTAGTNAVLGTARRNLVRNWTRLSALARNAAGPHAAVTPAVTAGGITFDNLDDITANLALALGYCDSSSTPDGRQPTCLPAPSLLVESVRINDADGEAVPNLYGTIKMRHAGGAWVNLFNRDSGNSMDFAAGGLLPLDTYAPVRGGKGYEITADMWDYDAVFSSNDAIAQGTITWKPAKGTGTFSQQINGQYGNITVTYRVSTYQLRATVNSIRLNNADNEDPAELTGAVAMTCGDRIARAFHASLLDVLEDVHPGQFLPLDERAITCGGTIDLSVSIWEDDGWALNPSDEVAVADYTLTLDSANGTFAPNIKGAYGNIDLNYTVDITAI